MAKSRRNSKSERAAKFKAALALARISTEAWAESQDVTPQHLYAVVRGDRESARLDAEVDAFISKHFPAEAQVA